MKKPLDAVVLVLLSLLLGVAAALPFVTTGSARRDVYSFEVELASSVNGHVQLFFDAGNGYNENDSSRQTIQAGETPVRYRFMLPTGTIRGLRFDPIDRAGTVTVGRASVRSGARVLQAFPPETFRPENEIARTEMQGGRLKVVTAPQAEDPILSLPVETPIALQYRWPDAMRVALWPFLLAFGASLVGSFVWRRAVDTPLFSRVNHFAVRRPLSTFALLAAASVTLQLHPVLFLGKSFVSPDNAAFLLYDRFPTLPGYETTEIEDAKGADAAAMMYQHVYFPILQGQALSRGEWPLWNRYNVCGVPMLGQGQSMFGELMNFLLMPLKGATWAWDLKFVLSRWLFAFGLSTAVWQLTRSRLAAGLVALVSAWIGYFAFRINHPAQFSVDYAPWIVVGWLLLRDAATRRAGLRAAGLLFLANWEVVLSGTVKEAAMLLVFTNLAGALLLLSHPAPARERLRKIALAAATGGLVVLISAPSWLMFLDLLRVSRTGYDTPAAMQIERWKFLGFFEDLLYRRFLPEEAHAFPSTNLVVLAGMGWAATSLRQLRQSSAALVLWAVTLLIVAITFQFLPNVWLLRTPFINNIHHIGNTFSCSLIVLSLLLAGIGISWMEQRFRSGTVRGPVAGLLLLVALLAWVYWSQSRTQATSLFFRGYVGALGLVFIVVQLALLRWRARAKGPLAAILAVSAVLVLWRHGTYVETPFDPYVLNPKVRVDLAAPSPAVQAVSQREQEPFRAFGLSLNLFSGYNQILGWEGVMGADAVRSRALDDFGIAGGVKKVRWADFTDFHIDAPGSRAVLDVCNVEYYLGRLRGQPSPIDGLEPVESHDLDILRSPTVWPRAFFTTNVRRAPDVGAVVQLAQAANGHPFACVLESDLNESGVSDRLARAGTRTNTLAARDYRLTPNSTTFTVDATGPGVIVLSETYYPKDFRVTVNGRPTSYFRVNYAFKGIAINQPGTYMVRFEYWPHRFTLSLWISAAGILLGIIGVAWMARSGPSPGGA